MALRSGTGSFHQLFQPFWSQLRVQEVPGLCVVQFECGEGFRKDCLWPEWTARLPSLEEI